MITPLITSGTEKEYNVMTATWTTPVSINPPLYGVSIAPSRYSHKLIKKHGEFGVCFLDFKHVDKVLRAGRLSGRDVNKFKELNLKRQNASSISAPILANSISALECQVNHSPKIGDHTFFVGEVVSAWLQEGSLKRNVFDLEKVNPIFYLGSNRFCTAKEWDKLVKK